MKRPALRLTLGTWLVAALAICPLAARSAAPTPGSIQAPARLAKAGVLKVAVDATYPPMEFEGPDGKPTGFDVDLATDLARRLGVRAEFVVMSWDGILAGLTSDRYDVIMSSMGITPERKAVADFVEYLQLAQVFVAKPGSNLKSATDLAGKVVAVQADTTSYQAVVTAKAKGVAIKDVKAFPLGTQAFQALKAGQAEVIVIDEPVARFFAKQDAVSFEVTGQALAPEPIGMAVKKPGGELLRALAAALEDAKADGSFDRISRHWFGTTLGSR